MKKLYPLLLVLCLAVPLYAQVLPPVGSGQLSGGAVGASAACSGDINPGCSAVTNVPAGALANQSSVAGFYRTFFSGGTNGGAVSTSVVSVFPFFDQQTSSTATDLAYMWLTPIGGGTFKNLRCDTYVGSSPTAPGSGKSYTVALRTGAAATTLTCPIADTNTTCSDTTHSVAATGGVTYDMMATPAGTPTGTAILCTVEFDK